MKIKNKKIISVILSALLAACFVLTASSCGEGKTSVLWYEENLYGVRCTVDTGKGEYGAVVMKLTYGETDHAIIESPEQLAGADFVRGDELTCLEMGGQMLDLSTKGLGDVDTVLDAFTIKEEDIGSIVKNDEGKTEVGVPASGGAYTVILGDDGLPEEIHFDGISSVRITDITILDEATDTDVVGKVEFVAGADKSESSAESGE